MSDRLNRQILATFSRARALHRGHCAFGRAVAHVVAETGLDENKVRAALSGGFSSKDTQQRLAKFNGLRLTTKHGHRVLIHPPGYFDPVMAGPGSIAAAAPPSFDEVVAGAERGKARLAQRLEEMRGQG